MNRWHKDDAHFQVVIDRTAAVSTASTIETLKGKRNNNQQKTEREKMKRKKSQFSYHSRNRIEMNSLKCSGEIRRNAMSNQLC